MNEWSDDASNIVAHYGAGGLRERIVTGLAQLGEPASVGSLGPVDEFHIGGRAATEHLIDHLELGPGDRVLDIGSGLGGTARHIASTTGATVHGVDLTPEYVEVANWLTALVRLEESVTFETASATALPIDADTFDAATMVHVGMNIADKRLLCEEVARILRPGARFAIYDIMAAGAGEPAYPVPWAASGDTSELATPQAYHAALEHAGFTVVISESRRDFARDFFRRIGAPPAGAPPPLGLHLVMGAETPVRVQNMIAAVRTGVIAPHEIIASAPS